MDGLNDGIKLARCTKPFSDDKIKFLQQGMASFGQQTEKQILRDWPRPGRLSFQMYQMLWCILVERLVEKPYITIHDIVLL
jgi:hypothetical protein